MLIISVLMLRKLWYQHREWMQEQDQIRIRELQQQEWLQASDTGTATAADTVTNFLWDKCQFIMVDSVTDASFPYDVSLYSVIFRTSVFIDSSLNHGDILQSATRFKTWTLVEQEWLRRIVL